MRGSGLPLAWFWAKNPAADNDFQLVSPLS